MVVLLHSFRRTHRIRALASWWPSCKESKTFSIQFSVATIAIIIIIVATSRERTFGFTQLLLEMVKIGFHCIRFVLLPVLLRLPSYTCRVWFVLLPFNRTKDIRIRRPKRWKDSSEWKLSWGIIIYNFLTKGEHIGQGTCPWVQFLFWWLPAMRWRWDEV